MADLKVEVDPVEVGLDADRLRRIDAHFQRYVDDGRLPGWLAVVSRHGRVAHIASAGHRDVEAGAPVTTDTLFRIYSMTKPITSVAAMILHEEGAFELKDRVKWYLPAFADTKVYRGGSSGSPQLEPQVASMRIWHLFTHTAGLSYGFHHQHPVDSIYRKHGFEWDSPRGLDTAGVIDQVATLPLVFQPGTSFNYSMATDVLGRLVEVWSGMPFDEFLRTRIFQPLGMDETSFWVEGDDVERLAALYIPFGDGGRAVRWDQAGKAATRPQTFLSGGGGLVSSAGDYHRFMEMLRRKGELDGARILSPRTVDYMTRNHLPGGVDLEAFGQSTWAETTFDGVGFGLGFSVVLDPVAYRTPGSAGEFGWGGAASTAFMVDPVEDMTVAFYTQLLPSSTYPIRTQLKQLVSQAIID
ncbi:serine hydrolase domain-containing protein [Dermatobacter hominis]|uniref:serine hydrolase domain-containing protein n=1 Tax=Dermatobacter hominis TaxID=2884263 RepID=UPI001D108E65|nr:serine hydrolase domain-containing protein [Dermatobacter hominis]UDY36505.1 beta-lactamase family protein [Dermatobacter hominis]